MAKLLKVVLVAAILTLPLQAFALPFNGTINSTHNPGSSADNWGSWNGYAASTDAFARRVPIRIDQPLELAYRAPAPAETPEPATLILFGLGVAAVGAIRRRRK